MALSVSQMAALTHRHIRPQVVDNFFLSNALMFRLKDRGIKWSGGREIVQPLAYDDTSAAGEYEGYDILVTTPNDHVTAAVFQYRQYYANVTISGREEILNDGPEGVIDLLNVKRQIAEQTLSDKIGDGVWGSNSSGKAIDGLGLMISTSSTYGGIAVADMARWAAKSVASGGALALAGMQRLFGTCTIGAEHPTLLVSNQATFDKYWVLLQANQRFVDSKLADAGFQHLMFNGVPYVVDSKAPGTGYGTADSKLIMLNEKYMGLGIKKGWDFKTVPIATPANQDVKMVRFLFAGNIWCSKREMQGELTGINPAS